VMFDWYKIMILEREIKASHRLAMKISFMFAVEVVYNERA
jgi:hypothetical protein